MGDTLLADRNVQDERRRALRLLARRAPTHGRWTSGQSTRRAVAVELEARGGCQELRACAIYPRLRSWVSVRGLHTCPRAHWRVTSGFFAHWRISDGLSTFVGKG